MVVPVRKDNPPSMAEAVFLLNQAKSKLLDSLDNDPVTIPRLIFLTRAEILKENDYPVTIENIRSLIPSKNLAAIRTMRQVLKNDGYIDDDIEITEAGKEIIRERVSDINRRIDEAVSDERRRESLEYFLKGIDLMDKVVPTIIHQDIALNNTFDDSQTSRKWPYRKSLFEIV